MFGALMELLNRPAIVPVLLFILIFKLPDAAMGFMVKPFWVDSGFSAAQIGLVSVNIGLVLSIAGGVTGGWITDRIGIFSALWILGLAQALSNLGYWIAAGIIPLAGAGAVAAIPFEHKAILYAASATESFTGGLGTAAFLAFLMAIVQKERAATEYALLSSVFALSRSVAGWVGGIGAQSMGYANWFLLTVFLAIPAYLLLPWVRRMLRASGRTAVRRRAPADGRPRRPRTGPVRNLRVCRSMHVSPTMQRAVKERPPAMNHHKYVAVAHRDHDYCNPLSAAKFERLLDLLPLEAASRVLDLGCGRAELALRIIERFGSTVIALDHSPYMLDAARERAEWTGALGRLHLDDTDIRDFRADPETFHLSVMLDAAASPAACPASAGSFARGRCSGGYVLIGVGYWKRRPPGELVALLGGRERDRLDHAGNVQAGVDAGLVPMHAVTATEDEWDEYEWKFCRSVERYAREQPDDPDAVAMLDRARRWRDAYLKWGRDTRLRGLSLLPPGVRTDRL